MQASFWKTIPRVRRGKNTLSFPITPLTIDPSLLNVTAFVGVSQPDLELADTADKDMWVYEFKRLTEGRDVAHQKATLVQDHRWSDVDTFECRTNMECHPDTYINMKKCAFGVLSIFGSTYICSPQTHLTDDSLQSL